MSLKSLQMTSLSSCLDSFSVKAVFTDSKPKRNSAWNTMPSNSLWSHGASSLYLLLRGRRIGGLNGLDDFSVTREMFRISKHILALLRLILADPMAVSTPTVRLTERHQKAYIQAMKFYCDRLFVKGKRIPIGHSQQDRRVMCRR
jgi:hypothetical protein